MTRVRKQTQRPGNLAKGAHTAVRGDLALAELIASLQSCPYHSYVQRPAGEWASVHTGASLQPRDIADRTSEK